MPTLSPDASDFASAGAVLAAPPATAGAALRVHSVPPAVAPPPVEGAPVPRAARPRAVRGVAGVACAARHHQGTGQHRGRQREASLHPHSTRLPLRPTRRSGPADDGNLAEPTDIHSPAPEP